MDTTLLSTYEELPESTPPKFPAITQATTALVSGLLALSAFVPLLRIVNANTHTIFWVMVACGILGFAFIMTASRSFEHWGAGLISATLAYFITPHLTVHILGTSDKGVSITLFEVAGCLAVSVPASCAMFSWLAKTTSGKKLLQAKPLYIFGAIIAITPMMLTSTLASLTMIAIASLCVVIQSMHRICSGGYKKPLHILWKNIHAVLFVTGVLNLQYYAISLFQ
jgi:hypothetical protein